MYETFLLQELRLKVCLKAGFSNITPSDCKLLSVEIRKATQKNISETTLKRFFGFAAVCHGFSKYTISALSEYANFNAPAVSGQNLRADASLSPWENLNYNIGRITDYVLKELRNRSGLPYEMTVSRKFAQHDFEEFYHSHTNFMAFIAQPGYGKTILLSHLVQDYFRNEQSMFRDSIPLFISASSFYKPDQMVFNLDEHLKNVLGIKQDADLIAYLNDIAKDKGKFFLIIDGFTDLVVKRDMKSQLFDEIINFICALDHSPSIKLIMNMRPTMWIRFYEKIRHSAYLKSTWFPGNYYNPNDVSNVPPLTEDELQEIIRNTGYTDFRSINPNLKTQLKFPFHIPLFFQLRAEEPYLSYSSNITFYELIDRFIQDKIFRSNYFTEKLLFLKKFVETTNYGQDNYHVEKDLMISQLMVFKNAYMELIADGILVEEKRSHNFYPKEYISFLHPQIFEYFIYMELLSNCTEPVSSGKILAHIDTTYKGNSMRFILLQWAVRHLIRSGEYTALKNVFKLPLINYERNYLVLFIAENLKFTLNVRPGNIVQVREQKVHKYILEALSNLDYIDSCYAEGVQALADICDKDQYWVSYQTILTVTDILSLNPERIQNRIDQLTPFEAICNQSFVNPLDFLKIAHARTQGIKAPVENLLSKVDYWISGRNKHSEMEIPDTLTGVFYMLLLGTNLFYGNASKSAEIVHMVYILHPKLIYSRTPFATYILLLYGIACAMENQFKKAIKIRNIVSNIASQRDINGFTLYSESLLIFLNAVIAKFNGDYNTAILQAETALGIFKRNNLNVNVLIVYNLIIETYNSSGDIAKMNEYKYEKRCFQEDLQIPKDIFPYSPVTRHD
ncbi:NACHT domain-containing protein [Pedobacter sp. PWIIR3]